MPAAGPDWPPPGTRLDPAPGPLHSLSLPREQCLHSSGVRIHLYYPGLSLLSQPSSSHHITLNFLIALTFFVNFHIPPPLVLIFRGKTLILGVLINPLLL